MLVKTPSLAERNSGMAYFYPYEYATAPTRARFL